MYSSKVRSVIIKRYDNSFQDGEIERVAGIFVEFWKLDRNIRRGIQDPNDMFRYVVRGRYGYDCYGRNEDSGRRHWIFAGGFASSTHLQKSIIGEVSDAFQIFVYSSFLKTAKVFELLL